LESFKLATIPWNPDSEDETTKPTKVHDEIKAWTMLPPAWFVTAIILLHSSCSVSLVPFVVPSSESWMNAGTEALL
jgi:peptidoglycan/xylan/chitin deacetylase (PgdA/CDA1 family)